MDWKAEVMCRVKGIRQWIVVSAFVGLLVLESLSLLHAQVVTNFDYSGAQLKRKSADADEYLKPDGTRIFKYRDREKAMFPDGTEVLRYPDGKRMIVYPDGMKLTIDFDGTRKYILANGEEKTVSLDSKTPYGEDVKEIEKRIKGDGLSLTIVYSAGLSDDQLDGIAKKLFDELVSAASSRMKAGRPKRESRLVMSNCKFSITGYCRRKNKKEISVVLYSAGTQRAEFVLDYERIYRKEHRDVFISSILSAVYQ